MSKFNIGEAVLYQNGERFELGIVKEVIEKEDETFYRVYYHTGDTSACTKECDLHKIANNYAFSVIRKSVDNDNDAEEHLRCYLRKKVERAFENINKSFTNLDIEMCVNLIINHDSIEFINTDLIYLIVYKYTSQEE